MATSTVPVQEHRARLRAAGKRPITVWLDDDVLQALDELAEQSATSRAQFIPDLLKQVVDAGKARQS